MLKRLAEHKGIAAFFDIAETENVAKAAAYNQYQLFKEKLPFLNLVIPLMDLLNKATDLLAGELYVSSHRLISELHHVRTACENLYHPSYDEMSGPELMAALPMESVLAAGCAKKVLERLQMAYDSEGDMYAKVPSVFCAAAILQPSVKKLKEQLGEDLLKSIHARGLKWVEDHCVSSEVVP